MPLHRQMSWLRKSSLALLNRVSALTPEATSVAQSPELSTRLGLTALQLEQRRWMAVPKRKVWQQIIQPVLDSASALAWAAICSDAAES